MIDETVNQTGQGSEAIGYCQDCGKPLTAESIRRVGPRTFCEPCLTTRVAAGTAYGAGTVPPPPGTPGAVPPIYTEPFPPMGGSDPSPALAALLGFIPGVGAMYNGQFAKGIAHIIVFAVLSSIAHSVDFFGLLVFGFVVYQVFEAYHTAKARREGRPLPDPFGLNNIGEVVGVHIRANGAGVPRNPGQPTGYPGWTGYVPPPPIVTPPPADVVPPAQPWAGVPVPPPVSPYVQTVPAWEAPQAVPPVPGAAPVGQEWVAPVVPATAASRVPAAAMWLIGFGVLFMIINFVPDWRWRFSVGKVFPFILMAWGVGIFIRRMTTTGGLTPTDSEGVLYGPRVACSLRAPVVLFTVGVLTMLQAFQVVRVGRTWPVLVIVIGLLLLLERSLGNRAVPVGIDETADRKGL